MLDHLVSQSFLDFHRSVLLEANINHLKSHPFDHGLTDSQALNLHALDHRGNYDRELTQAFSDLNDMFQEETNPFNLSHSL